METVCSLYLFCKIKTFQIHDKIASKLFDQNEIVTISLKNNEKVTVSEDNEKKFYWSDVDLNQLYLVVVKIFSVSTFLIMYMTNTNKHKDVHKVHLLEEKD